MPVCFVMFMMCSFLRAYYLHFALVYYFIYFMLLHSYVLLRIMIAAMLFYIHVLRSVMFCSSGYVMCSVGGGVIYLLCDVLMFVLMCWAVWFCVCVGLSCAGVVVFLLC